jgi:hypothetical protein
MSLLVGMSCHVPKHNHDPLSKSTSNYGLVNRCKQEVLSIVTEVSTKKTRLFRALEIGMHKINTIVWLAGLTGVALAPSAAFALSCKRPPPAKLLYPKPNRNAPRNAAVYVLVSRLNPSAMPKLYWVTKRTYPISTRAVRLPNSPLVVLIPKRPLKPHRLYEVRLGKFSVGRFRTTASTVPKVTPKLMGLKVVHSKPYSGPPAPAGIRCYGRWVKVHSKTLGGRDPSVVQFEVTFTGRKRVLTRGQWAAPYAGTIWVASMCTNPCSFIRLPVGPLKGRYIVKLTPWSKTGTKGPTVTLRGSL